MVSEIDTKIFPVCPTIISPLCEDRWMLRRRGRRGSDEKVTRK